MTEVFCRPGNAQSNILWLKGITYFVLCLKLKNGPRPVLKS